MIKTLEELRNATNEQVLDCIKELERKKVKTSDFQQTFGTDYSYTTLVNELKSRGYEQAWTKKEKKIVVRADPKKARMNLNMTLECKTRYEKFLQERSYNYLHTSAALMYYMEEYMEGNITPVLEAKKETKNGRS